MGSGIVGGVPPPPSKKYNALLSSSHLPLLIAEANAALPVILQQPSYSSSLLSLSLPPSSPAYYGWLLCVGRMGLDMINAVIASQIIIIIITISLPFPPGV
jgi:hypothetical protein